MAGTKITDFANSIVQNKAAHHELPHLDLHCLPSFFDSQFHIA